MDQKTIQNAQVVLTVDEEGKVHIHKNRNLIGYLDLIKLLMDHMDTMPLERDDAKA